MRSFSSHVGSWCRDGREGTDFCFKEEISSIKTTFEDKVEEVWVINLL